MNNLRVGRMVRLGLIVVQGDVAEHRHALQKTLVEREEEGEIIEIRKKGIIESCDAIVIPGGESTTIGKLLEKEGIASEIKKAAEEGKPIMGTCAGLVLLAKGGDGDVAKAKQRLLEVMDVKVKRNAFGRQRESFECDLKMSIFDNPFHAVFIRAPAIIQVSNNVRVLAELENYIVAAEQGNILALAFHPELTEDTRIHHYFLDKIR